MIKIEHVFLKYVRQYYTLYDVNLNISLGEAVAFLGQKDSGKTSLLRMLVKLEKPTKGKIYIKNIPLTKIDFSDDVNVGYLPSTPIFFEHKSVYENLLYVEKLQSLRPSVIETAINKVLKEFEIEDLKETKIVSLTLFQKYIVSLARLALRKIDVLLVDDVLDNLEDTSEQEKIIQIFKERFISSETVFILSTANEKFAKKLCKRVVMFENGSVFENGENK